MWEICKNSQSINSFYEIFKQFSVYSATKSSDLEFETQITEKLIDLGRKTQDLKQ